MSSKLARAIHFSGVLGLVLTCALFASLPSSQTISPASFAAPPLYSVAGTEVGITGIYSMAKGDFNGDGIPDIAVAGFAGSNGTSVPANSIAVYLGNGDGTFKPPVYYAAGPYPYEVVVGHVRGDNTPEDLVVVGGHDVTVLLGNGDGTFQSPKTAASFSPSFLTAAAIGDFNGDGKPDIAIAVFGGSGADGGNLQTLAIILGNGDGTFAAPVFYQSANNPYGVAVGDFNKDGKLDIVIRSPDGLFLSLGNGDGTFLPGYPIWAEPISFFVSLLNGLNSFTVADFNGDGNLDIAANVNGARVDVILGTGKGTFVPASTPTYLINQHQTGNGLGQIAAASLTNSGKIDLVVNTGYGATLAILRGNGDGTFQSPLIYPLPEADDEGLIVADVNRDGRPDIVTGTSEGILGLGAGFNYLTVMLNKGNGDFGVPPPLFSVKSPLNQGTATNAVGVTLADLTGNGKLDLVVTDWDVPIEPLTNGQLPPLPTINVSTLQVDTHGTISVLAGNGDGTFQTEQQYYVGGRPIAVAVGDLTGNGKKDVVVVNAFDNTLSILKANGDRTFQPAITIPVGTNPTTLALADFNGDGKPDIAVTNLVDNSVSVLINQSTPGNISFKTAVTYAVGTYPAGIVARDFNHDGILDLAIVNSGYYFSSNKDTTLSILKGNGDGTFQPATTQVLWGGFNGSGGDAIAAADFGTGQVDLAVANFSFGQIMILHGHGDGTFTAADIYKVGAGPEGIAAMDFNGDGKIDLAVNDLNDNTVALLLGNGDGTFQPIVSRTDDTARPYGWATWGYPAFITAGDLNGDGKPDIVVTNLFEAAVTVLRNTTITPVQLTGVVSRKDQGSIGTFDLDLPLLGKPGIECRSGGANGDYTLIFSFSNPLTSVESVSASATSPSGPQPVSSSGSIGTDPHQYQYIVNLSGVPNAQYVTVALTNVTDSAGNFSSAISASMGVLIGDVDGSGGVDSGDVFLVRQQTLQPVTGSNFREDINASGDIDSADVFLVRKQTLTSLP